jgi:hypothetical protein
VLLKSDLDVQQTHLLTRMVRNTLAYHETEVRCGLHGAVVALPEWEVFPHNSVNTADAREPLLKGKALHG